MEGRPCTEKGKHICLAYIVFLLVVLRQCDATEVNNGNDTVSCFENEYEHNGFCCDKCSPGFKLLEKCLGKGLRSKCIKCSNGTYQDHMNHFPNCFSCRKPCNSADKEIEIAQCTHKQDRKCGCENGYYENEINDDTMSCVLCRKCGTGERETRPCNGKMDRKCECMHNHYRVAAGICADCANCSSKCSDSCPPVKSTESSLRTPGPPLQPTFILGWVCLCVMIASLICIISLYTGVRHFQKRKQSTYSNSTVSCDTEKQVEKSETHIFLPNKEDEGCLLAVDRVLPDCIPREIKTHEFIYFVLDIVPVSRFKELVRRLNVSEQDIDRAERDNRAFADAQYQMLMVWVDSGTTGAKNVLPPPLLQDCVERLKVMNLTACAESIETKYG